MSAIVIQILIFLGLLILSAFFSGSETALFGLKDNDLSRLRDQPDPKNHRILSLLEKPKRLLIVILTGNTIVNIAIGVLAAVLASEIATQVVAGSHPENYEILIISIEVIVVTFIILMVGEISPKILAIGNTRSFSRAISLPLYWIFRVLYPLAAVIYSAIKFITDLFGIKKENLFLSEEEIRTLVEVSENQGALHEQEKEMIYSIFDFGDTYVREIMIPRIDMVAIPTTMRVEEVIEIIKQHRYSRIPLYDKRVDNITGIIFAKDVLPYLDNQNRRFEIARLARPAYFVPEKMKIDKLLREFQQRKTNIAIVVDEYGGTSGLVTLEDIIEEIVGEIRDEYDFETPFYRWLDDHSLLVNARITLDDLEDIVNLGFPEEREFDTLGGFLYSNVGDIPEENTEITFNDVVYTINKVQGNRIKRVLIEIPDQILNLLDEAEPEPDSNS